MGYRISTLGSLPILPGKNLYVFVLAGNHWRGGDFETITENFDKLAKELGPDGAIVIGHDGVDLSYEVVDAMYSNGPEGIQELIIDGNRKGGAFLILSKHPSEISNTDTVLFAPLEQIKRSAGGFDQFLSELCEFAKNRNKAFLRHFRSADDGWLKKVLRVVELKPNIAGIGLNLNALLEKQTNA